MKRLFTSVRLVFPVIGKAASTSVSDVFQVRSNQHISPDADLITGTTTVAEDYAPGGYQSGEVPLC